MLFKIVHKGTTYKYDLYLYTFFSFVIWGNYLFYYNKCKDWEENYPRYS